MQFINILNFKLVVILCLLVTGFVSALDTIWLIGDMPLTNFAQDFNKLYGIV